MEKIELTAQQRAKKKYYEKIKNNPEFRAKVLVEGKEKGEGKGKNKKEAEKAAAEDALAKWKNQVY